MLTRKMLNHKRIIGSVFVLIIFVVFLITGYFMSRPAKEINTKEVFNENSSIEAKGSKNITVYVNGEVKNPGVYKLKEDSRIEELIKNAGGFNEDADKAKVNLAKKLRDEDYIYIDKKGDSKPSSASISSTGTTQNEKVNINTANKEQLKTIQGIGDVTAQKIIDYREKNGAFSSIEDLKKVGRMGDKTIEKIKDKIEVR